MKHKKPIVDIRTIVESNDTLSGQAFDIVVQIVIVLSVVAFSIETLPDLDPDIKELLNTAEVVFSIIFTFEYVLRLYAAEKTWRYVFSFYGLVDFIAIVPFYLFSGVDLQSVKIFRMLYIFRLLKLFRYNKAIIRFSRAFRMVREEMTLFSIVTLMLLYLSAMGIYFFENEAQPEAFKSVFHSLWWAVATLTTVGYGDVYPITAGGKLFTFFMLMIGLGIVAVPTGLLASALSNIRTEDEDESEE